MRKSIALILVLGACSKPQPPAPPTEVRAVRVDRLPDSPDDPAWVHAPVYPAGLQPQDVVEPRKMAAGTAEVRVQALTDGRAVAFRLRWKDAAPDTERRPASFGDACAVQFPSAASTDLPSPMMGERGREVLITLWSAAAQTAIETKGFGVKTLYPNSQIDHYPFTAAPMEKEPSAQADMALRYAPAKAAGNPWPPEKPVTDLAAQGAGTLRPAPAVSSGTGRRESDGWLAVIVRPLPAGTSSVSFAVWDGGAEDAGPRKMWCPWVPLNLGAAP